MNSIKFEQINYNFDGGQAYKNLRDNTRIIKLQKCYLIFCLVILVNRFDNPTKNKRFNTKITR